VIEFIEECRQEWKRLGVPDPIANEMAVDLSADIEEAEAEGGSAEDVLGSSLFDPRRFAAAWADARGVTAPPAPKGPSARPVGEKPGRKRPVLATVFAAVGVLFVLLAAALVVGHQSAAVAVPVRRILAMPGSIRLSGPTPAIPPFRYLVPGPSLAVQNAEPIALLAIAVLLAGIVGLGLAVLYWSPWSRHDSKRGLG
jgi:hypothetical protein